MDEPVNFTAVIEALLDESKPFPPALLYNLSGIYGAELRQLTETWPAIQLERRRGLLDDLEELAGKDYLLDFDNVGRIGLKDPDPTVCINAISLLWQAEDRKLIPQFITFMQTHAHEGVRAAAAGALAPYVYLGEVDKLSSQTLHEMEEALLKATNTDKSALVRRRALESLGFSSRDEVPDLILRASRAEDTLWLESALYAMGRSAESGWAKNILPLLDHDAPEVVMAAVHAAGELELSRARTRLLRMLSDSGDDYELQAEIIWALSQIGGEGIQAAFEDLLDETEDPDLISVIEEALDNLDFTEDADPFDLLEVDYHQEDYDDDDEDFDDFDAFDDDDDDY